MFSVFRRLNALVTEALSKAGLPTDTKLECLGLSLSGLEREETNRELETTIKEKFPGVQISNAFNLDHGNS